MNIKRKLEVFEGIYGDCFDLSNGREFKYAMVYKPNGVQILTLTYDPAAPELNEWDAREERLAKLRKVNHMEGMG